MCDTCPSHIPGPVEAAASLTAVVGAGVDVAMSKPGRRVMFWGFAVPMLPFAVWGVFGWWTIALAAVVAVGTAAGLVFMRAMSRGRHVLLVAPPSLRQALPAPRPVRAVALPRNLAITRRRRALPSARKALPAAETVITGRVVGHVPAQRVQR